MYFLTRLFNKMSLDKTWVIRIIYKLLSSSGIIFKLCEDMSKYVEFEFCFASKSEKFNHVNNIKVYHKKGKIFWKMTLKTLGTAQSLEGFTDHENGIYTFDWTTDEKNLSVGGFRKCIYTAGVKEYAEEFLRNSFDEFRKIYERLNN